MAYCDAYNVQFLDLSGVDEDEKKWILRSLQTIDSTVKGPWKTNHRKNIDIGENHSPHPEYNNQVINCHYHPPATIVVANHVNAIPQTIYTPPYQPSLPIYQHPFVSTVPYQSQIVALSSPVGPVPSIVPINTSIVQMNSPIMHTQISPMDVLHNQYTQQVAYTNYAIASPIMGDPYPRAMFDDQDIQAINMANGECGMSHANNGVDEIIFTENNINSDIQNGYEEHVEKSAGSDAGKSWASLFNKKTAGGENHMENLKETNKAPAFNKNNAGNNLKEIIYSTKKLSVNGFDDPNYYRMGEALVRYTVDHHISSLQPRGLLNRSNYCYINSILQALLACPPFFNLLSSLSHSTTAVKDNRKHTQIIDNMLKFVHEFHPLAAGQRVNRRSDTKSGKKDQAVSVNCDRPFEPHWIYRMLNGIRSDSFVIEGRQEDAEEFLGCLLNGLNDEMLELMKLVDEENPSECDHSASNDVTDSEHRDKEWQVIGPKNKGCVTRRTEIIRTPISDIFGGHIRSRLHRAGDQITDNIQPFFTLQLNIEKVNSVREALEALVSKNQLEGVTSSKTNEEVEAWQQVTIEELPVVLVLHLKCFDFQLDGCTKIVKALEFPVDLKLDSKLLSSKTNYQTKEKQYKLFAVVYHDGKEATKGHYVTDAYHIGYASWLRYDDAAVKAVQEENVLKPQGTRVPYLLFYRRCDTVRSK